MLVFLPTKLDPRWHQWGNLKWIQQGRKLDCGSCFTSLGWSMLTWRTHRKSSLRLSFQHKRGRGASLGRLAVQNWRLQINLSVYKTHFRGYSEDSMQPILTLFSCTKSQGKCVSGPLHEQTKRQFPRSVCWIVYYMTSLSLFDTDTLSQGPETGSPLRRPRQWRRKDVSLAHTQKHTHTMWHTLCQSRHCE